MVLCYFELTLCEHALDTVPHAAERLLKKVTSVGSRSIASVYLMIASL